MKFIDPFSILIKVKLFTLVIVNTNKTLNEYDILSSHVTFDV